MKFEFNQDETCKSTNAIRKTPERGRENCASHFNRYQGAHTMSTAS